VPGGGGHRRRLLPLLALVAGCALLAWVLHRAGLDAVWQRLRALGWSAPLILLPFLVMTVLDASGWRLTLPARPRVPLAGLVAVRTAGEAVNSLTPAAAVGEPVKAYLLRRWHVPASDALASVVISKTALVASQSVFTALGVPALLWRLDRPNLAVASLLALSVGCAAFIGTMVWVQHRNPGTALWKLLRRIAPRAGLVGRLEAGSSAFDHRLREFYRDRFGTFARATGWHFLGWLVGVVEVALMTTLVGGPVSWLDAFLIETLSQPIRAAALVIPAGIGTQELGGVWLCRMLGMGDADAVTFWLLRRARETIYDVLGLLYLAQHGGRRAMGSR
jgi:putative membrane protein